MTRVLRLGVEGPNDCLHREIDEQVEVASLIVDAAPVPEGESARHITWCSGAGTAARSQGTSSRPRYDQEPALVLACEDVDAPFPAKPPAQAEFL
ncbi:hypothetical protein JM664_00670 [Rhodobacteraceae bacterium MCCB 386]|nr:hypothetical protein [Roseitranquillus sediminis]